MILAAGRMTAAVRVDIGARFEARPKSVGLGLRTEIGRVPHPRLGSVWATNPNGKPSKSLAKVISRSASTTTFEVSLYSGRPHQIRIHLASIGHMLVGDPLYGVTGQPLETLPDLPGDGGYFLHAEFLKFHHPITGEQINLEAALPSGFPLHQ